MDEKVILIADDAAFMRRMIRNALTAAGYANFLEAPNGRIAVEMYREHKPDLVLMDVTMPEMDGLEALKAIMAEDPAAKVVMCSAIGQDATIMDAIRSGAGDFVVKPFKNEQLAEIVGNILSV